MPTNGPLKVRSSSWAAAVPRGAVPFVYVKTVYTIIIIIVCDVYAVSSLKRLYTLFSDEVHNARLYSTRFYRCQLVACQPSVGELLVSFGPIALSIHVSEFSRFLNKK